MDVTLLKRMIVNGARSFVRSGSVSFATVLVMTVTIGILGMLIFLSAILSFTLGAIKDKVDVNVYFVTTASEVQILDLEKELSALPEVERVTYTSREEALEVFKERHAGDQLTLQALEELGDNPLGASLAIKAKDPSQYESIVNFLSDEPVLSPEGTSIVDRVNYFQNKTIIDRLSGAIRTTETVGGLIVLLFALASTVIIFATIRLAIYTTRDEIAVMRLMGASNMFIRGPYIVTGVIAGVIAAVLVLLLFYPISFWAASQTTTWLGGFNLFTYYTSHFALFFLMLLGAGILLGGLASYFAVRRYLKV